MARLLTFGILGAAIAFPGKTEHAAPQKNATVPQPSKASAVPGLSRGNHISEGKDSIFGFKATRLFPSGVRVTGSNTGVRLEDPIHKTILYVYAGDITVQHVGKEFFGIVRLNGASRYTLIQKTSHGERRLEGKSGGALYERKKNRMLLNGGVTATVTDNALFQGPATLNCGSLTADLATEPFLYLLSADGRRNCDIRLTLLDQKNGTGSDASGSKIHVSGFETGKFQPGIAIQALGPDTALEEYAPAKRLHARLNASRIDAGFAPNTTDLSRAEADGNVRYLFDQAFPNSRPPQSVAGTAGKALYLAEEGKLTLSAGIDAVLDDSAAFSKPGTIHTGRLEVDLKTTPFLYTLSAEGGGTNDVRLELRPRENASSEKAGAAKSEGESVHVTRFRTGAFRPALSLNLMGPATTIDIDDLARRTNARIQATQIDATFDATGSTVHRAEASGEIHYHGEQPAADGKTRQSIDGTAGHALLTRDTETVVELQGPLQISVSDPGSMETPSHISGLRGDTLRIHMTGQGTAYELESPGETMTLEYAPLERKSSPEKAPAQSPAESAPGKNKPSAMPGKAGAK